MSNAKIAIDDIIIDKNTTKQEFANDQKFREGSNGKIYYSIPNEVVCFNHRFYADIKCGEINVRSIKLFPIIENVEKPHYPDKKYQEISWNYCKKVLMDYFHFEGQTVKGERSETFYYNFENMEIYTRLITKGQEEYTGGYIVIEMCRRMF